MSQENTTTTQGKLCPFESCPLSNNQCTIIGGVVLAIIVLAIVAIVLKKRCKKSGKCSGGSNNSNKKPGDVVEIYVGNLSYDMTENQFRKEFERFGVVKSARIITHRTTGKSKGYGFVEMPHRKEAMIAIKSLNNRDTLGRKLRVNEARNGTRPE